MTGEALFWRMEAERHSAQPDPREAQPCPDGIPCCSIKHALPEPVRHERETTTPMEDGTLLADCSCGATYSVPQGGGEYGKLERAHRRHVAAVTEDGR
jgi:hypothetical protein